MLSAVDTMVYKVPSLLSKSTHSGKGGVIIIHCGKCYNPGKHGGAMETQEKNLTQSCRVKEGFLEKSDDLRTKG